MLDVFSVRCHKHNTSFSRSERTCPRCLEEQRAAAPTAVTYADKMPELAKPVTDAELATKPVTDAELATKPLRMLLWKRGEPSVMDTALLRLTDESADFRDVVEMSDQELDFYARAEKRWGHGNASWARIVARALAELEERDAADAGQLQRYELPGVIIAPRSVAWLNVNTTSPGRLLHFELAAEYAHPNEHADASSPPALSQLLLERAVCGTRILAEGGTLAQLERRALARVAVHPGIGAALDLRNAAERNIVVRGALVCRNDPIDDGSTDRRIPFGNSHRL